MRTKSLFSLSGKSAKGEPAGAGSVAGGRARRAEGGVESGPAGQSFEVELAGSREGREPPLGCESQSHPS